MSSSVSALGASQLLQLYLTQSIAEERSPQQARQNRLNLLESKTTVFSELQSKIGELESVLSRFQSEESNPFDSLTQVIQGEPSALEVDASPSATPGTYTAEIHRLASADTRVTQVYESSGSELKSFFDANGSQTFSIEVASPTAEDADNRVNVAVTLNPTGVSNESILEEIADGINQAMADSIAAGTIFEQEAAFASILTESSGKIRLVLRSGKTGYNHRLGLDDSANNLLSELQIAKNAVVTDGDTQATPATLTGNSISGPFTVDASNNTLAININGTSVNATLTSGAYASLSDLATELGTQLGDDVIVGTSGDALTIQTVDAGASATLEVTGGNALELLGFGDNATSASVTGDALAGPIVIDKENQDIDIAIDGVDYSATLSKGTYATIADLAAELESEIGSDKVSVSVENDALKIETVSTGAASSIQIKGGEALETLGFRSLVSSAVLESDTITGAVTVITNSNDQLRLEINGSRENVRVAGGTYTDLNDLAAEIETEIGSDIISVTVEDSKLRFETVEGGSSSSIQVIGGDILSSLGLSAMADPVTGTDMALVSGTDAGPIDSVSGTSDTTTVNASPSSLLAGPDSGGMLREVGTNEGNSLLTSSVDIDGINYTSDVNSFSGIIEGVTISLKGLSDAPEDFTIEHNTDSFIDNIDDFVATYNALQSFVKQRSNDLRFSGLREDSLQQFRYNSLRRQLRNDISYATDSISIDSKRLTDIGFSINYDGTLELTDESALIRAIEENPDSVESLFNGEGGLFSRVKETLNEFVEDRGVIEHSRSIFSSRIDALRSDISSFESRLNDREEEIHTKYGLLEQRLSFYQAQQESLTQLSYKGIDRLV